MLESSEIDQVGYRWVPTGPTVNQQNRNRILSFREQPQEVDIDSFDFSGPLWKTIDSILRCLPIVSGH